MSAAMFIKHVTLTTGHSRRSLAGEVAPEAVAVCRDLIRRITAGDVSESVRILAVGPYSLAGRKSGRCLVATVYADGPSSESVCTIGVAAHSRCGAKLWRELHRWGQAPVVTDPDRCPPEPWVAAALDAGITRHPDALQWLGDFERCLAWAWMEEINA
jgi:hypothetical protein